MEGAVFSGDALADDPGVLVDEDGRRRGRGGGEGAGLVGEVRRRGGGGGEEAGAEGFGSSPGGHG